LNTGSQLTEFIYPTPTKPHQPATVTLDHRAKYGLVHQPKGRARQQTGEIENEANAT
jgi:hypothetical protein